MKQKAIRIAEVRDPNLFQRLVSKLLLAEHGIEYQVVDDSGGDGGLDGFLRTRGDLYACYCPEKPETADYHRKIRGDLRKAQMLRDQSGYPIRRFIFVTPFPLREPSQRLLRDAAKDLGFEDGINVADEYLEVVLARHPQLQNQFPALSYPRVAEALSEIGAGVQVLLDSFSESSPHPLPRENTPEKDEPDRQSYSRGLFRDIDRSSLSAIEAALVANDPGALFRLDRVRLSTTSLQLAVACTLMELQHAIRSKDHVAVEAAALRGAVDARIAGLKAEEAVFRANTAQMLIRHASDLDREIERRKRHFEVFSFLPNIIGFFYSRYANSKAAARVADIYARVDNEIQSALTLARDSMNLDALHTSLEVMVYAESKKVDSLGLLAKSGLQREQYFDATRRRAKAAHETLIRTARLMGDAPLSEAYYSYSLDLMFVFKEAERALVFAQEERIVAARAKLPSLIERTFKPPTDKRHP